MFFLRRKGWACHLYFDFFHMIPSSRRGGRGDAHFMAIKRASSETLGIRKGKKVGGGRLLNGKGGLMTKSEEQRV